MKKDAIAGPVAVFILLTWRFGVLWAVFLTALAWLAFTGIKAVLPPTGRGRSPR